MTWLVDSGLKIHIAASYSLLSKINDILIMDVFPTIVAVSCNQDTIHLTCFYFTVSSAMLLSVLLNHCQVIDTDFR